MKISAGAASAALLATVQARVVTPREVTLADVQLARAIIAARAEPANQPNGYAPQTITCPTNTPVIRSASGGLSPNETAWLEVRRNVTIDPMRTLLARLNITGLNTTEYINNNMNNASALPNIGIAVSGGGYRAMLNGAGVIQAFDNRTVNSSNTGQLGGLLQAATYLSALSGGGWLVGSLYSNNFTSISSILGNDTSASNSGGLWQLGNSIFEGPSGRGIQLLDTADYYDDLIDISDEKKDAGYHLTITDYWGRALSYQLVNATNGGPDYTFSSIADQDWFQNGEAPLPILVSDGRKPGDTIVSTNTTVFQFDPWELGTFDPTVYAFAPLQYVGTNFSSGSPVSTSQCVVGFDNVGFVMGTSSSLFSSALSVVNGSSTTGLFSTALQKALTDILEDVSEDDDDIADWVNPFFGYNTASNPYAVSEQLTLVDGGTDDQNVPLHPLIQPVRAVDVIFAVDSSADTNTTYPDDVSAANWPDGASLVATYQRSLSTIGNGTAFPVVPGINTFLNLGLNTRPTFFGCNETASPLIVYMPNAAYSYFSNVSTYDLEYNDTQRNQIIMNGYNGATQGNASINSQWPTCVGCAILSRSLNRTGTTVPDVCTSCFTTYCWNGTVDESQPATYQPSLKLGRTSSSTTSTTSSTSASASATKKSGVNQLTVQSTAALIVGLCVAAFAML